MHRKSTGAGRCWGLYVIIAQWWAPSTLSRRCQEEREVKCEGKGLETEDSVCRLREVEICPIAVGKQSIYFGLHRNVRDPLFRPLCPVSSQTDKFSRSVKNPIWVITFAKLCSGLLKCCKHTWLSPDTEAQAAVSLSSLTVGTLLRQKRLVFNKRSLQEEKEMNIWIVRHP